MKSFVKVFAIIYVPFTISALIVFYILNSLQLESAEVELLQELKNKWKILVISEIDQKEKLSRHKMIHDIFKKTKLRITFVLEDGKVIDDGYINFLQISEIENHRKRPELSSAFTTGEGNSTRYSFTTKMEMLYYAKKVSPKMVMRVAYPKTYLLEVKETFSKQLSRIFLFLFFVTAGITAFLARKISLPVQKLNSIAESLEAGKSQITFPTFQDTTMTKVSDLIHRIYQAMHNKQIQLQEEQKKRNYIYSILEEGIILLDDDNRILYFNENAKKYLGVDLNIDQNLLTDINDFQVIDFFNDILANEEDNIWKKKELKSKIFDINLRIGLTTPDRSIGDSIDLNGTENRTREKLIVFYNITEKVKYEIYKSKLIGNISHELRTPLSMIMGYSETILNDPQMPGNTKHRFLEKIYKNSKRINGIIADILELHKLESIGSNFKSQSKTKIKEVISDLNAQYSRVSDKKIHFEQTVDTAMVNFEHLFSILSNLIGNAIKYSKGKNIYIEIRKENALLVLSVEDEGPVISDENRGRIFERFYTASNSRNKANSGTGLGLPIVKHIAQLYKGDVKLNKGTKNGNQFVITLK